MRYLPKEIWQLIVEYVQAPLRIYPAIEYPFWDGEANPSHSLLALYRTSRTLHEVTRPFIYQSVGVRSTGCCVFVEELNFLGTRPDLARLVQHICINDIDVTKEDLEEIWSKSREYLEFPEDALEILGIAIAQVTVPEGTTCSWEQLEVPLFILCAAMFPNLTTIKLSASYNSRFKLIHQIQRVLYRHGLVKGKPLTLMPNLRRIIIQHADYLTSVKQIADLFLPQIEEFHGWRVTWDPNVSLVNPYLRKMCLYHSFIEASGVANILTNCPKLQILRIDWADWGEPSYSYAELNLNHLGDALRQHGINLEELKLDFRMESGIIKGFGKTIKGRIGSLQTLENLKELSINMDTVIGSEDLYTVEDRSHVEEFGQLTLKICIPGSLERLTLYTLTDDSKAEIEQLEEIYDEPDFGKLESITLIPYFASKKAY